MGASRRVYFGIGIICIALGAAGLARCYWPAPLVHSAVVLAPDQRSITEGTGKPAVEGRQIQLDYPAWMRTGETVPIHLAIIPDPPGEARPVQGLNVEAEAWLELDGASFLPDGITSTALLAGKPSLFEWQMNASSDGKLAGRAWLAFRFLPQDGSSDTRRPITAQPIAIQVFQLAGLTNEEFRVVSGGVAIFGLVFLWFGLYRKRGRTRRKNQKPH